jgi:hypothetical protein
MWRWGVRNVRSLEGSRARERGSRDGRKKARENGGGGGNAEPETIWR